MRKMAYVTALITLLSGCASAPAKKSGPENDVNLPKEHVEQGYKYLQSGKLNQAVEEFDLAIKKCEPLFVEGKKIYTARTSVESLMYVVLAAGKNEAAEVLDTTCSDAYYLQGYATLDFGKIEEAETYLQKAVSMAPMNSLYLSELGHIYQVKRDWSQALAYFTEAEDAAQTYTPEDIKISELGRAKRGVGFNLIELGKLDDAERKFREALALDGGDKVARNELEYIKQLRTKK